MANALANQIRKSLDSLPLSFAATIIADYLANQPKQKVKQIKRLAKQIKTCGEPENVLQFPK